MKSNIAFIEIEKETLYTVVKYKSGAVRWYNVSDVPRTVADVVRKFKNGIISGNGYIVARPFVSGSGTEKDPYQYKECVFARIELV